MWEAILASTVISTLISSAVVYINFQKENQLKYITQERKEWRDKLREIAYNLQGANIYDTMKLLTELKVRINTYGFTMDSLNNCGSECEQSCDYLRDMHVWSLISDLEKLCSKEKGIDKTYAKQLAENQKRMILYISLMLKYDWERSKNEISGIKKIEICSFIELIIEIIASIIVVTSCVYLITTYIKDNVITGIVCLIIALLLLALLVLLLKEMQDVKKYYKEKKPKKGLKAEGKAKRKDENYESTLRKICQTYKN